MQVTRDQNLATELADSCREHSDQPPRPLYQNVLLQALGAKPNVTVPVSFLELRRGDWIIVCSDGLTTLVHDEEIGDALRHTADPHEACHALVETANARGGQDNITILAAYCNGPSLPVPQADDRLSVRAFALPW